MVIRREPIRNESATTIQHLLRCVLQFAPFPPKPAQVRNEIRGTMARPEENPEILRDYATCQKPGTSLAMLAADRSGVCGAGRVSVMAQLIERGKTSARGERDKAVKILAKSIFRELKTNGYEAREIVALSTELLDLLTNEIKPDTSK